ncbi:polysaccharide lyase family 7 protein [Gayadomonas joobiniege]|uniref:polysaccharide lyase family 7 protein n=1 Tax=Gayadomonas joobiniege TaxID=1234606 RepID=UPI000370369C|nr:polysaccharide lyase family 7 protein [Gayadomonas joobiniege]
MIRAKQSALVCLTSACGLILSACGDSQPKSPQVNNEPDSVLTPGQVFDLSKWNLTIPLDLDNSGNADTISSADLANYQIADFFYLDKNQHMVFAAPNKAITTPNSTNTRSELRQVFDEDTDDKVGTRNPKSYFALASNPEAEKFASIGARMQATLKVNHVSVNAKYGDKPPAYSVVVGQIHAGKLDELRDLESGFGWGNEPLKIYYKKYPHHATGSVFWNYERNLTKDDPNRIDIAYPVWGDGWNSDADPGKTGIALGETFSYTVNVSGDIMYLEFSSANHATVKHQINLANNLDANGQIDEYDQKDGYRKDWLFFKAGAYNQCSSKDAPSFRYPACPGTGDWQTDKADGNYTSVTFSRLELTAPVAMNK